MCSLRLSRVAKNRSELHFSVLSAEDTQKGDGRFTPLLFLYMRPRMGWEQTGAANRKQKERNYLNVCIQATFCSGLHLDE